jgi:drug/metabolite transporter (DMT)-like permease
MRLSRVLGLVVCNILWSSSYATSKHLFATFHPLEVSFLRNLVAGLPLLIYCAWGGRRSILANWLRHLKPLDSRMIAVGTLTFFVSPVCQMTGLNLSRAVDSSLMVAMEPLFTVFAACLLLGERLASRQILSFGMALIGAGILSEVTWGKLLAFADARLVGNLIFLISIASEASYSVFAKPVLDRRAPVLFLTVSQWTGIVLLFGANVARDGISRVAGLAPFLAAGWSDQFLILYMGLGCSLFAYLYWMNALKDMPVSILALSLYVQPVLGVAWGACFLGETVGITTAVGAALILTAVWLGSRARHDEKSEVDGLTRLDSKPI